MGTSIGGGIMYLCNPDGFRRVIHDLAMEGDEDKFFTWFDGGNNKEEAFEKAQDVFTRLMLPYANKYLKNIKDRTSLDVGYGSGGQVLTSTHYFDLSLGVDVHEEQELVSKELGERGASQDEFLLYQTDGYSLPMSDRIVDFVYSWVTFLHFETLEVVKGYLKEIFRVLSEGGVAVIYFPRLIKSSPSQTWREVKKDIEKEKSHNPGYREGGPLTRVKSISIVISMWKMESICREVGFKILEGTASWSEESGGRMFHGQYGIVIQKPKKSSSRAKRRFYKGEEKDIT